MLRFSELSHLPVFCNYFRVLQRRYFFSLTLADYEAVVKLSDGFNGADLRNVCTEAGLCGNIPIALKFSPTSFVSLDRVASQEINKDPWTRWQRKRRLKKSEFPFFQASSDFLLSLARLETNCSALSITTINECEYIWCSLKRKVKSNKRGKTATLQPYCYS